MYLLLQSYGLSRSCNWWNACLREDVWDALCSQGDVHLWRPAQRGEDPCTLNGFRGGVYKRDVHHKTRSVSVLRWEKVAESTSNWMIDEWLTYRTSCSAVTLHSADKPGSFRRSPRDNTYFITNTDYRFDRKGQKGRKIRFFRDLVYKGLKGLGYI